MLLRRLTLGLTVLFATGQATWSAAPPTDAMGQRAPFYGDELRRAVREQTALPPRKAIQRLIGAGWQSLGPYGGSVVAVELSPRNPLIGLAGIDNEEFAGGLYRSTDGGLTWRWVAIFGHSAIIDLAFAADGTAYVGTQFNGLWRSIDDGVTWNELDLDSSSTWFETLAVDPNDPDHVWMAGNDFDEGPRMMSSTDGGETWNLVTRPISGSFRCQAIVFDPDDSQSVFAAFATFSEGRIWHTADGGVTWLDHSAGLPNVPMNALAHDGERLLLGGGVRFGGQSFGVYASSDDGASWTALHDATWANLVVQTVAVEPGNSQVIYAGTAGDGVYRSTDGGETWEQRVDGTAEMSVSVLRFAPASSSQILLGVSSLGVLQKQGVSEAFELTSTGISDLFTTSVAANPLNGVELAISFQGLNDGGIYVSTDSGATWQLSDAPATRWGVVAFAPDGTLYGVSTGPSNIAPEGVYRRNADATWSSLGPDQGSLYETTLTVMAFSQSDPELLFAAGRDSSVLGGEATIWRSVNGGASWKKVYLGTFDDEIVLDLVYLEGDSKPRLVAAVYNYDRSRGGSILRSSNGGSSWAPSLIGLPDVFQGRALCTVAGDGAVLAGFADNNFPAQNGGLFRSADGGFTWTTLASDVYVEDLLCHPHLPHEIYAAQRSHAEVVRSLDQGRSFKAWSKDLQQARGIRRLAHAPSNPAFLLLATESGIFRAPIERFFRSMP